MSERTVTSPAGREVLVFEDREWAELAGLELGSKSWSGAMSATAGRMAVLAALWLHGDIEDRSGRATSILEARALELESDLPSWVNMMLRADGMAPCCEGDRRAKRTYAIRLVALPARWLPEVERMARRHRRAVSAGREAVEELLSPTQTGSVAAGAEVMAEDASAVASPTSVPAPAPEPPEAPRSPQDGLDSPLAADVASAVATALLAQVVEVLSSGAGGPKEAQLQRDLEALTARLGTQVDYVDKLRRDCRAAGDQILALRQERDGLRERLRQTEHNLRAATSQDAQRVIDAEVRRQVDRMMRQAPTRRSSIDADLETLVEATS